MKHYSAVVDSKGRSQILHKKIYQSYEKTNLVQVLLRIVIDLEKLHNQNIEVRFLVDIREIVQNDCIGKL